MTTHHHEETTMMRVPPSPDATTPTDRTPEPVRVVNPEHMPNPLIATFFDMETITDRAAIRDSDEADEFFHDALRDPTRGPLRAERMPVSGATVAALDLDAITDRAKRAAWGWGAEWTAVVDDVEEWSTVHADGKRDMVGCEDGDVSRHIAGMDPATTLALVDALARVTREAEALRAQVAAVEAHIRARHEYVQALKASPEPSPDYHRWQGNAEARRHLCFDLGGPCLCGYHNDRAALATTGEGK